MPGIPDWVRAIIIAGEYGDEFLDVFEQIINQDVDGDGTIGITQDYCADGVTIKEDAEGTNCPEYAQFGYCADGTTKKQDAEGTNCAEYAPNGYCQDGTTIKSDAAGTNCSEYAEFGYCQDGTTKKQDAAGTNCSEYAEFGYCEDGTTKKEDSAGTNCSEYTPDYGMCDDGLTEKEDAEGTNCPGPEPVVNEGDPCNLEDGTNGTYQYVDGELHCIPEPPEFGFCQDGVTEKEDAEGTNCDEYTGGTPTGPDGIKCEDGYPQGALTFALQDQQKWWTGNCGEYCNDGTLRPESGVCEGEGGNGPDDLCDDGSEPFYINFDDDKDGAFTDPRDGKNYTYDPCDQTQPPVEVPGPDDGNDACPDPNQVRRGGIAGATCVTPGQVCFAEPSKYPGDSTTTQQGQYSTEGFCIDVSGGQCTNGNTPEYLPEDTDQDGAFFYDGDSVTYDPCADDLSSSMYFTPAPELVCNDQNADPPAGDDGGCGPCKSGFDKPEGYDVCTSIVDICAAQNVPGYGPDDAPCKDIDTTDPCTQADPNSQSDGQGGCECKQDFTPDLETGKCVPSKQDPQQCKDDDGNPTGATDYPDCVTCPTGQDFNEKGICVETTQPSEPCPDYNGAEGPRDAEGVCIDCEDPANAEICSGKLPPEVTCEDPNAVNDGELGECGPCKDLYDKPEGYDVCTSIETLCQQDEEYAKDNELCQGPCDDGKVEFIDENGEIFCDAPCAYNDQIASSSLDCVAPECANGATDYPDCVTCPSGQRINPETDKCEEVDCTDPANALFCGWVECDDGTMAPTLGDCEQETPCSDPEYAATHPLECGWVECPDGSWAKTRDECEEVTCENGATDYPDCTVCPEGSSMDAEGNCVDCSDCSCAEYAAANPEECITQPPVTPPPSGGGGGGGGGSMFDPFMAGISYTPQAVPEPPAPAQKDYMAELDNIIKRSLFEGMA
jgi:hypothetical protein